MISRSDQPTEVPAAERRWTQSERARHTDRGDQTSPLARAALAFALQCHAGQRRSSDGAPFVEHPREVERLLRDAGCSDDLAAAGLLHDVIEDANVSAAELTARFGARIANLVQAVSDDACVYGYRQRKRMLREQVRSAGDDAALLFAAEKISKLRELPDQIRRDRARFDMTARESRARNHTEHHQQMRLEHYHKSLEMLQRVAPRHPLVNRLKEELDNCPITMRRRATARPAAR